MHISKTKQIKVFKYFEIIQFFNVKLVLPTFNDQKWNQKIFSCSKNSYETS